MATNPNDKTIYNMDLHETIDATSNDDHSRIVCKRVASGWLYFSLLRDHVSGYEYQTNPVFVPFDNTFMNIKPIELNKEAGK